MSCSSRGTPDGAPADALYESVAGTVSSPQWHDPRDLGAPELNGYSPAPRRKAAPARTLRTSKESGCNKSLPSGVQAGKTVFRTVNSGELKRSYRLHYPAKMTNAKRMPLLLNFHGRTGTGIDQEYVSGLAALSDRESFILVSPDGTGTPSGWSAGATAPNSVDDVKFVNDLLDTLEREFCVDGTKVYATGFSNGAFMSSKLACLMPERIAAIAAVGGVHYPWEGCNARVPVLAIHGTSDAIVPMNGGSVRQWRYPGAVEAMNEWAANNGCAASSHSVEIAPGAARQIYEGCGASTELVIIEKAGHVWPGAPGLPATNPGATISGAELVWAFLSQAR